MRVRPFEAADWAEWLRMGLALFPHHAPEELEADMRVFRARADAAIFVAVRPDGTACGYVEAGSRPYADGCRASPVGYIEAWYVDPDGRLLGYGRALLEAAEAWAREAGYREMASDALLENVESQRAHERSGYAEVGRIVQFCKLLG